MRLYAISVNAEFIKFGVSNDPVQRIINLQTSAPYTVQLLSQSADLKRKDAFLCERTVHCALWDFHERLEWFRSCPKTLAMANLIKNQEAPRILDIASGWATQDGFLISRIKGGFSVIPEEHSGIQSSKISKIFKAGS